MLRPGKWRPARSLAWMVAMVFAIVLSFGPSTEALAHALPAQPVFGFLAKAFGALIIFGAYVLLVRVGEGRWPSELSLRSAPTGIMAGLLIGAAMFTVVMAAAWVGGVYHFDYHGLVTAWRGAGLALESGVLEEVIVRGVVLRLVWRASSPTTAFVVSGLLFGAGHFANPGATLLTTACVAIEAGVMLGAFYALTGRLWVSIGVHSGWNFTQGYLFGAQVSGGNFGDSLATTSPNENLPDWLTGGTFGPEASVIAFAMCSAVGAVVLWLAWRAGRFSGNPA
ncbi:CPBP family intramembrane glutamic endopeptidase [Sphingopyxis sp.]|uniref:CPBP family intramembrane glutamic endopeptidase n=1 Tax=Sphingopyxis sp. TaxID=1908224 RepID=UPI003BAC5474